MDLLQAIIVVATSPAAACKSSPETKLSLVQLRIIYFLRHNFPFNGVYS